MKRAIRSGYHESMTQEKKHDIAIIGAGPGGYVAAIKAAQMGKSVALIEKEFLGGTCLNVGCIPTKTLLASAAVLHQVKRAAEFGIDVGPVAFHYAKMVQRKDAVIATMRKGLDGLMKANQVTVYTGSASFETAHTLKVLEPANTHVHAETIILATGSVPVDIKAFPCDHKRILNSSSILQIQEVPKRLAIIGGGYIGCEFASLFSELGAHVTVIEALPSILSLQGSLISGFMTQSFAKRGIQVLTDTKVEKIVNHGGHVTIHFVDGKTLDADLALVAVGRKPYTEGLNLQKAGLKASDKGFIAVDARMQTEVQGVFAIGDLTGEALLAHVASHQGIVAAINACGGHAEAHYNAVPAVIFTQPEIASVGMTLEMAGQKGIPFVQGTFPFQAIGKAQAAKDTEGMAQIIAHAKTGEILGATVIGHEASSLIAEMTLAIENEIPLECLVETIHAHPTLPEVWHEAACMALGNPIHLPPKKR